MTRTRTVLCVDDNADFTDNLREILEDVGYRVHTASSHAEAIAAANAGFDVALVDVRLPDGDGTTLAVKLRESHPDSQVILLTGFATLESAVAAVRAGAWAYLMKPCATPELLVAVEQAARQVELHEEKRDLARRATTAEKLAAIGRLTAGLSHEIKNPLNAAALQLAVLERRVKKLEATMQPTLLQPLELVRDEITRLNRVLEEFLQFARPREPRLIPVDLGAMLGRVADLLAEQAERAGVQLERGFDGAMQVAGDEGRLRQAIMNLALNAIQATQPGGRVRVTAAAVGREVEIAIEDSGPGIPDEMRRRIFEPFFTTKEGGSGLGLPLVHAVIEEHGGTITVERAESGGARFVLRLPSANTRTS
jgi:two-component system, NtrC family, sensor histidine kinase HydH